MAERIKILIQKRTSLKSQITNLNNLIDGDKIDNIALKLRIARVTDLYHAFEEHNDELAILDPEGRHEEVFMDVQNRFCTLAARAEKILNAANALTTDAPHASTSIGSLHNDTIGSASTKKRRIKLPEAPLPTFDGKYENWMSFKNAFHNMIGSQEDLSDIDKLHYLKSALVGDAVNKLRILAVDGVNYSSAWDMLEKSYEVKRVLISRHLSLLLNMPSQDKETTHGISKIADDTQQHVASLNTLGVTVGPEMIVHIIEGKLPRATLEKWETSLKRDEYPKLEEMYEFLYKIAVCASRRERNKTIDSDKNIGEPPTKRRRFGSSNKAFIAATPRTCAACKSKPHPLYLCDEFKRMTVPKRIELIKGAKLCYNCLRSHKNEPCRFSNCTVCQKRHNTMLHLNNNSNHKKSDKSDFAASTSS